MLEDWISFAYYQWEGLISWGSLVPRSVIQQATGAVNDQMQAQHCQHAEPKCNAHVLEEARKASARHFWFKCLQAKENTGEESYPQGPGQHHQPSKMAKGEGKREKTPTVREKRTSSAIHVRTQRKSKEHHAREGQTTVRPDCRHSAKIKQEKLGHTGRAGCSSEDRH